MKIKHPESIRLAVEALSFAVLKLAERGDFGSVEELNRKLAGTAKPKRSPARAHVPEQLSLVPQKQFAGGLVLPVGVRIVGDWKLEA